MQLNNPQILIQFAADCDCGVFSFGQESGNGRYAPRIEGLNRHKRECVRNWTDIHVPVL